MKEFKNRFVMTGIILAAILALPSLAGATQRQISIQNFIFSPHGVRAIVGDTITWTNRDVIAHTATSDNGVWNSGTLENGQHFSFVFTSAGTFPYHCTFHPSMKDTIFVSLRTKADDEPSLPGAVELMPNYPNPFNAQTSISFLLPSRGQALLEVYDMLGQKLGVLYDGDLEAGNHMYTWSGNGKTSGIYFYRLSFNGETRTGRMVLLK